MNTRIGVLLVCGTTGLGLAAAQTPPASQPQSPPPNQAQTGAPVRAQDLSMSQLEALAHGAFNQGQYEMASRTAAEMLRRDPSNLDAKLLLGDLAELGGDLFNARKYYREVLDVQPGDYRANYGLGRTYLAGNQARQAQYYLEQARRVAAPEQLADLLPTLATAYREANELLRAEETARLAVQANPTSYAAHEILAIVGVEKEDFPLALDESAKMVALAKQQLAQNPGDRARLQQVYAAQQAQLQVLSAYHNTMYEKDATGQRTDRLIPGNEAQAAAVLKQIVDLFVLQAEIERTLSYFQLVSFAERMVKYQPNNVDYVLQLALLQLRTNQLAEASQNFQHALELDPQNQTARQQLERLRASGAPASPAAANRQ